MFVEQILRVLLGRTNCFPTLNAQGLDLGPWTYQMFFVNDDSITYLRLRGKRWGVLELALGWKASTLMLRGKLYVYKWLQLRDKQPNLRVRVWIPSETTKMRGEGKMNIS